MEHAKKKTNLKLKMNKKTILALISSAFLLIAATVILVSCDWFNTEEPIDVQVHNALQEVLNVALSGDENTDGFLTETESRNGFEVLSCEETDIGVSVTVKVYSPDLYAVAKEIDEHYIFETEEELQNAIIEGIGKAQIIEQEITMEFIKTEAGYEPVITMEFIDAYYGGVIKLIDDALSKMEAEETR